MYTIKADRKFVNGNQGKMKEYLVLRIRYSLCAYWIKRASCIE